MGGMRPYEISEGIIFPLSTQQRLDRKVTIRNIIARSRDNAGRLQIEFEVNSYLAGQGINEMRMSTVEELIAQMQKQMKLFTLLLGTMGSISLIVGDIGVMNVMLVSVTERTKEIGIRRALGAREGDILFQFLVESVILCIVGGVMGVFFGIYPARQVARLSPILALRSD